MHGAGARALFGDGELTPIRGQLVFLLPQPEVELLHDRARQHLHVSAPRRHFAGRQLRSRRLEYAARTRQRLSASCGRTAALIRFDAIVAGGRHPWSLTTGVDALYSRYVRRSLVREKIASHVTVMRRCSPVASILIVVSLMGQVQRPPEEFHIYTGVRMPIPRTHGLTGSSFRKMAAAPGSWSISDQMLFRRLRSRGPKVTSRARTDAPRNLRDQLIPVPEPGGDTEEGIRRSRDPSVTFQSRQVQRLRLLRHSDHSQEAAFQPADASNPQWMASKRDAAAATSAGFVGLAGIRIFGKRRAGRYRPHQRNQQLGDAERTWRQESTFRSSINGLRTAEGQGGGPVVASFNHPTPDQYNNWDYRDPKVTEILTTLEVINSNNKIHSKAS